MHIGDINVFEESGLVCCEATVTWEEVDRPPLVWFAEVDAQYRDRFWADPNAFLVGAILPAWHAGERRIRIEGALCPVLTGNIKVALGVLRGWYPEMGPAPAIEPARGFKALPPCRARAVSFLSCGIDSLLTLRWNMLQLPADHPDSITAVICFEDTPDPGRSESRPSPEEHLRRVFAPRVAADAGVDIIRVRSNYWHLDGDGMFYNAKWHGAAISSLAYFFSRYYNRAYIASSNITQETFGPWGSHPLLDLRYSSAHLKIEHFGIFMSRFEKLALIADWPAGLQNILVCQSKPTKDTNCGFCRKCIATMTGLVALGKLQDASCFPTHDVTPKLLSWVQEYMLEHLGIVLEFEEMIPALEARGRDDLVAVIRQFRPHLEQRESEYGFATKHVADVIPPGSSFVVAEPYIHGRLIPAERKGRYWGAPSDAATAIREVEHLREAGAELLVYTPRSFWQFEVFEGLEDHLWSNYRCLRQDEQYIVFDLRSDGADSRSGRTGFSLWGRDTVETPD